jgi:hypothetical protein
MEKAHPISRYVEVLDHGILSMKMSLPYVMVALNFERHLSPWQLSFEVD